jgi:hypothetical protein
LDQGKRDMDNLKFDLLSSMRRAAHFFWRPRRMQCKFNSLPTAFRERDFSSLDASDYADLLLDLGFRMPHRGRGAVYLFSFAKFHGSLVSVALFALRDKETILIKQAVVEIQADASKFSAPDMLSVDDFAQIPLPVVEYISLNDLAERLAVHTKQTKLKAVH